jgi:transposase
MCWLAAYEAKTLLPMIKSLLARYPLKRVVLVPNRIRAHALACFMALILYCVMRMRLKASNREESPTRLLQQLQRIHQQTVRTADGQALHGLTEITTTQKSLFTVLQLPAPTPAELSQPGL